MFRTTTTILGLAGWAVFGAAQASADLIINGNFEQGNTGFTTEYTIPPTTIVGGTGQYLIVTNPANHHPSGASYGDHTTGIGRMMMVNESASPMLVWGQSLAVEPGADYRFSGFISSWVSAAPSELEVVFNGVLLGIMRAPAQTGVWQEFAVDWNSGLATTLTIALRNRTTADVGGDFALDDIALVGPSSSGPSVPEPASHLLFLAGASVLLAWKSRCPRPVGLRVCHPTAAVWLSN